MIGYDPLHVLISHSDRLSIQLKVMVVLKDGSSFFIYCLKVNIEDPVLVVVVIWCTLCVARDLNRLVYLVYVNDLRLFLWLPELWGNSFSRNRFVRKPFRLSSHWWNILPICNDFVHLRPI